MKAFSLAAAGEKVGTKDGRGRRRRSAASITFCRLPSLPISYHVARAPLGDLQTGHKKVGRCSACLLSILFPLISHPSSAGMGKKWMGPFKTKVYSEIPNFKAVLHSLKGTVMIVRP